MSKKYIIIAVLAVFVAFGTFVYFSDRCNWPLINVKCGGKIFFDIPMITPPGHLPLQTSPETTKLPPSNLPVDGPSRWSVTYLDSGYSPNTVKIKKGDTVIWKNQSKFSVWTASAVHPTHKIYPGSGMEMCGMNTLVAIFDACKGFSSGESWDFRFNEQGTWKYHNHLQPNHAGTIIVE